MGQNVKIGAKMTDVVTNILEDVSIYVCLFMILLSLKDSPALLLKWMATNTQLSRTELALI